MSKQQVQEFVDAMLNHRYDDMSDLIKEGFDINQGYEFPMGCEENTYGYSFPWTPLQFAVSNKMQETVDFLIKNGAKLDIKDKSGRTAEDISDFLNKKIVFKK
eukprot:gene7567-11891_t